MWDRIVFMVVTLRAIHRQAKKRFVGMFDGIVEPGSSIEQVVIASQKTGGAQLLLVQSNYLARQYHRTYQQSVPWPDGELREVSRP